MALVLQSVPTTTYSAQERAFTVAELKRASDGNLAETGVKFVWDARTQSAPRDFWEYGVTQRTSREDYVGADEPSEQVLGPKYDPFDLAGFWDDRYAGDGFADATRVQFEQLVQRGNPVRLTFENISITGLITNFKATYKRKFYVGWRFTFSPHFRNSGGDLRRQVQLAPQKVNTPQDYAYRAQLAADSLNSQLSSAPKQYMAGDLYSSAVAWVNTVQDRSDTINSVISTRVFSFDSPVNDVARVVQAFRDIVLSVPTFLDGTAPVNTTTALFYDDALQILVFEAWLRAMNAAARTLLLQSAEAADALQALVHADALAIYRPYAGESLYAISNRFYRTPHRWYDIYDRNQLSSFTMTGAESLIIPRGA